MKSQQSHEQQCAAVRAQTNTLKSLQLPLIIGTTQKTKKRETVSTQCWADPSNYPSTNMIFILVVEGYKSFVFSCYYFQNWLYWKTQLYLDFGTTQGLSPPPHIMLCNIRKWKRDLLLLNQMCHHQIWQQMFVSKMTCFTSPCRCSWKLQKKLCLSFLPRLTCSDVSMFPELTNYFWRVQR